MSIRTRLRSDLATSLRSGDKVEVSMLRTLIGAIENAEAVEAEFSVEPKIGLNHDQARRELSDDDVTRIVTREREELADAVARYRKLGLEEAVELERRLEIVDRYLG